MKLSFFLFFIIACIFWGAFFTGTILLSSIIYDRHISSNLETKDISQKVLVGDQKKNQKINFSELLENANLENGEKIFRQCMLCHSFQKNSPQKVGPSLYQIYQRAPASLKNFPYSKAMKAFSEKNKSWDAQTLNLYLASPRKLVPGTSMLFFGIRKAKDRADLILYLETLK